MYMYIFIYLCVCVCLYIYIYTVRTGQGILQEKYEYFLYKKALVPNFALYQDNISVRKFQCKIFPVLNIPVPI